MFIVFKNFLPIHFASVTQFIMSQIMTVEGTVTIPQPPVPHAKPTLIGLSQELRREICEHLSSKDLANVCLVSHTMRDAAVRALYRNISLKVADCDKDALKRVAYMLSRENPGIDHIQTVHLLNWCEEQKTCKHYTELSRATTMYLINGLPKDQLKSFSWDSSHNWKVELGILLLKRQRKLKHVELHATNHEKPCIHKTLEAHPELLKVVENAESFHFEPTKPCCLDTAKMMLAPAKKVRVIKLSANYVNDEFRRTGTNDEGGPTDPLFTRVFGYLKEPGVDPLRLTSLTFENVDLGECKANYARVMIFENLKRLRLNNCWRLDLFLECMMQPEQGCAVRLEELIIFNTETDEEHQFPVTLDSFLGSFKGLKNIQLGLVNPGVLPALRSIIWHGTTLEKLCISVRKKPRDAKGNYASYTGPAQLKQLASSLPQLKQLALSIDNWPNAMKCTIGVSENNFEKDILFPLAEFQKLQLLNIINWPAVGADCDMPIAAYGALLRTHATAFFRAFKEAQVIAQPETKPDTLRVLVFGEHKDFENSLDGLDSSDQKPHLPRFVYHRDKGKERWEEAADMAVALQVEEEKIKDLDINTDLLKNNYKFRPSWGPGDDW